MNEPPAPGSGSPAAGDRDGERAAWRHHHDQGEHAAAAEHYEDAIRAFGDAVLARPDHVGTHLALGRCFERLAKTEAARRIYEHAARIEASATGAASAAEQALAGLPPKPAAEYPFGQGQVVRSPDNTYRVLERRMGAHGAVSVVEPEGRSSFFDRIGYRRYALKTVNVPQPWSEEDQKRFADEAITWLLLDRHPNIVTALWVERVENLPCILLEFVSGGDLASVLDDGPLDMARALRLGLQFCDGMDHAARTRGVVHGDVKAANCLLAADDILKITDFGLAQAFGPYRAAGTGLSELKEEVRALYATPGGTLNYRAPEQSRSGARVDVRTDIYGFGVLLYQMVTGDLPFSGAVAARHITARAGADGLPELLRRLILSCVERAPRRRPQNFRRLRGELQAVYELLTGMPAPPSAAALPSDADLYVRRGAALDELGRHAEALEYLDKALQAAPGDGWALHNRALTLIKLGRPDEALACLDEAIERNPGYEQALSAKARLLASLGRSPRVGQQDQTRLRSPGAGGDTTAAVTAVFGGMSDVQAYLDQLLGLLDQALEANPRSTELWTARIALLVMLGRNSEAARSARTADAHGVVPGGGAFRALLQDPGPDAGGPEAEPTRSAVRREGARYSAGVQLAWQLAAAEAKAGYAGAIEPVHLLLAVCKLGDGALLDQTAATLRQVPGLEPEIEDLRRRFSRAGLDATRFRRRLRAVVAQPRNGSHGDGVMHRTQAARRVFARARELAATTGAPAGLAELLRALLELPEQPWHAVAAETGDVARLQGMLHDDDGSA